MRALGPLGNIAVLFVAMLFLFPSSAYAYLDPGTGSYVIQMFIAGLLGAFFAVKMFWRNITLFLKGWASRDGTPAHRDSTER